MVRWRVWYDNGEVYDSKSHLWADLPDDGILLKLIYYADGTKQIQQNDWYFIAPHFSGEEIHATTTDARKDETEKRYPGAIFKRGRWGPDEYYAKVKDTAFASTWNDE